MRERETDSDTRQHKDKREAPGRFAHVRGGEEQSQRIRTCMAGQEMRFLEPSRTNKNMNYDGCKQVYETGLGIVGLNERPECIKRY